MGARFFRCVITFTDGGQVVKSVDMEKYKDCSINEIKDRIRRYMELTDCRVVKGIYFKKD